MGGYRTVASAGAALVLLLVSPVQLAGASQDRTFVVHLDDRVRMPAEDLDSIKNAVDEIFHAAGATVSWAGGLRKPLSEVPCDGLRHVAVVIISGETPFSAVARDTADVLGRAAPDYGWAWVFSTRVAAFAGAGRIDPNVLLARAIAHEIGHLLLPAEPTHAAVGIMRPSLEMNHVGLLRFTPGESNLLRAAITDRGQTRCSEAIAARGPE